jgi:hypothetical protein
MRISVTVEELLPTIKEYIREKYGLKDDVELDCSSKTTFLSFDTPASSPHSKKFSSDERPEGK